jgi:DNA (cytosine-5)-methyltransferase 1
MNELALFAGSGGGILGGHLLGWRTVAAVEIEDYPRRVLLQRQADGLLPRFPVWDDICTFDGKPWRGRVDVISGGFPCQDISAAGKGDGLDGERSGLWTHMARVVSEVRPPFVFVENSPMLTTRGGTRVIADLTQMGYDTKWTVMGAADVGAPHQRDRMWIVGKAPHAHFQRLQRPTHKQELESKGSYQLQTQQPRNQGKVDITNPQQQGLEGQSDSGEQKVSWTGSGSPLANPTHSRDVWREWELGFTQQKYNSGRSPTDGGREWWATEPSVGRVANGVAHRVDRLKAIGNGQVPLCAATAWQLLTKDWELML